jgi:hypothetical protein
LQTAEAAVEDAKVNVHYQQELLCQLQDRAKDCAEHEKTRLSKQQRIEDARSAICALQLERKQASSALADVQVGNRTYVVTSVCKLVTPSMQPTAFKKKSLSRAIAAEEAAVTPDSHQFAGMYQAGKQSRAENQGH